MDSNTGDYKNSSHSYADDLVKDMEGLIKKFENMGAVKLFWDGKVPEKNKSFFNIISFKSSNKMAVIEDVQKYIQFFEAMLTAMRKLNGDMQMSESEESDPLSIVVLLKSLLCDMDMAARSGLKATDSSAVYQKHSEFIEMFSQLDSMVHRVECIVSREKKRNLTKLLDDCQKTITGLQISMKELQNIKGGMEKQIAELVTSQNEKQRKHQQSLEALNAKLKEDQKDLLGQYKSVCNRLDNTEVLLKKLNEKK